MSCRASASSAARRDWRSVTRSSPCALALERMSTWDLRLSTSAAARTPPRPDPPPLPPLPRPASSAWASSSPTWALAAASCSRSSRTSLECSSTIPESSKRSRSISAVVTRSSVCWAEDWVFRTSVSDSRLAWIRRASSTSARSRRTSSSGTMAASASPVSRPWPRSMSLSLMRARASSSFFTSRAAWSLLASALAVLINAAWAACCSCMTRFTSACWSLASVRFFSATERRSLASMAPASSMARRSSAVDSCRWRSASCLW
mmetsp:Transcript_13678/g.39876  ORF Transcript_13678/g.39876 Transcript_13678/m.39876 type:complete len:262 (+) Transcript_13678:4465-5250(+)